jgi:hypothetical protein
MLWWRWRLAGEHGAGRARWRAVAEGAPGAAADEEAVRGRAVRDHDVLPQGGGEVPYESPLEGGEAVSHFLHRRRTPEQAAAHEDEECHG